MASQISQMIVNIFAHVSAWFQQIMIATDGLGFWLGCFLVWQVASKLLFPAMGGIGRGSDQAVHSISQHRNVRQDKRDYYLEG